MSCSFAVARVREIAQARGFIAPGDEPSHCVTVENSARIACETRAHGAAQKLVAAQKARGVTLSITSALRTLPQQYLLYRWYQTGRCGIGLAGSPGTSNHEGAIAVDINDNAGWRSLMNGKGFRWLGSSDPVHYDFTGGGTVDLRGISVKAFQRLWNRNNPTDKIAEDGDYGPGTAACLAKSPSRGFVKGVARTQIVRPARTFLPAPAYRVCP